MEGFEYILFDLDGTIIKSEDGVIGSMRYALHEMGLAMPENVPNRLFMGPPISYSFREYCNVPEGDIERALKLYRAYYSEKGIFECELYPGVYELLTELYDYGKKLLVASSKPELYVTRILERFDALSSFEFVGGASMDSSRATKDEVLEYVINEGGIGDRENTLMVGDRSYDILGAKKFSLSSAGVTYGYGSREELKDAGADYIVDKPHEIIELCGIEGKL